MTTSTSESAFERLLKWLGNGKEGLAKYSDLKQKVTMYFESEGLRDANTRVEEVFFEVAKVAEREAPPPDPETRVLEVARAIRKKAQDRLLWLLGNGDVEVGAQRLPQMQLALEGFFRSRGFCESQAESLRVWTLGEVIAKLMSTPESFPKSKPEAYIWGFAKIARKKYKQIVGPKTGPDATLRIPLLELFGSRTGPDELERNTESEHLRLTCMEKCFWALPVEKRALMVLYEEAQNKKELSKILGIKAETLAVHVARIRSELKVCLENCVQVEKGTTRM